MIDVFEDLLCDTGFTIDLSRLSLKTPNLEKRHKHAN